MVGGAAATFDPATDTTALVNAGTYYLYITGQNLSLIHIYEEEDEDDSEFFDESSDDVLDEE